MRANKELTSQLVFNNVVMLAQFVLLVVGFLADPLTLQFKFMKPKLLDGQLIMDMLFRFVTTLCLVCSSRSGAKNARDPIFNSGLPIKAITSGQPSVPIIKSGIKNASEATSTSKNTCLEPFFVQATKAVNLCGPSELVMKDTKCSSGPPIDADTSGQPSVPAIKSGTKNASEASKNTCLEPFCIQATKAVNLCGPSELVMTKFSSGPPIEAGT